MWIERLDVRGFRGLVGEFTFSQTLTLVVGDNEAGKSSLHEALIRALFGFSRTERRRTRGPSLLERRAPWHGGSYGLVARLQEHDRGYRVEWDFTAHRAQVIDDLGVDLTGELQADRDEIGLGESFLGIGIDDFRQVCSIDQDELSAVRNSPTLGVALQEAVATAGGGIPVEHAIERLNDYLRSVGARTDTLRPSPAGQLNALGNEQRRVAQELRLAEQAREEIEELAREAAKVREELTGLEAEREQIRQRLLGTEADELEQRLAEARRLEQKSLEPNVPVALSPEAVEEVGLAFGRVHELAIELGSATAEAKAVEGQVDQLEAEQRVLKAGIDGLEPYAGIDAAVRDEVREAWAQFGLLAAATSAEERDEFTKHEQREGDLSVARPLRVMAGRPLDPAANAREELSRLPELQAVEQVGLARGRVQELATELGAATAETDTAISRIEELEADQRTLNAGIDGLKPYADTDASARDEVRETWAQFGVHTGSSTLAKPEPFIPDPELARYKEARRDLLALTAAASGTRPAYRRLLWIALFVVTFGIAWLVRRMVLARRPPRVEETLVERLQSYGAASIDELDARVVEEERLRMQTEAEVVALRRARAEAEERQRGLALQIEAVLDRVGAPAADLEQRVAAYLTGVERHEQLREQEAKLARVERELEEVRRPLRERRRLTQEHERAVRRLRDAYAVAGVDHEDLAEAHEVFERLVAEAERARQRLQEAEAELVALRRARAEAEERQRGLALQIEAVLDRVGAPAADLEQRVAAYLTGVERHEQLREQEAKLARVERELEEVRRPLRERRRLTQEHERAVRRLRDAYAVAGVDHEDLAEAHEVFERLVAEAERARKRLEEANAAAGALQSLLEGKSVESLEARAADAGRRYSEHRQTFGDLASRGEGTPQRLASELSVLDAQVEGKVGELRGLEARVADREEQAGDPVPLKEQLATVGLQLAKLEDAKEAVGLAREVLAEAAEELRREFAPHLNAALERNLALVTGGRYSAAFVDGELNVQVRISDGQLKSADELSRATKDQLFLIERLEIARLLSPTRGSAPLLLDDPFAHYDRTRLRRGLEIVAEVAKERQVVVFSEDRSLIEAARGLSTSCLVIELRAPPMI